MNAPLAATSKSDTPFYALAIACGAGAGWADVMVNDLLFTALLVLASCMLLGLLRSRRPWRWVAVVGACIPLTEFACCVFAVTSSKVSLEVTAPPTPPVPPLLLPPAPPDAL